MDRQYRLMTNRSAGRIVETGETMTARERVKRAIHFQHPDRIPHFLPDGGENDLLWLWPGRPADRQPWADIGEGRQQRIDCWGSVWEKMGESTHGTVVSPAIPDITQQQAYSLPPMNAAEYLTVIHSAIVENEVAENPRYCLGVMPFVSLHEGTHNLVGLEAMLAAYYEHADDLNAFIARMTAAQQESIRLLAAAGCDGVMGYDDWGLQDRLMVRPELIEEFFLPHYRDNWQLAHDLGMDVWLHSCGYIIDLLPAFIDAGLNVIQMDQQENMGLEPLDAVAGGKLAFWCPVDIQQTMVNGSLDDIRAYVQRMMNTLGAHHGGLISMAYSTPEAVEHTPEKIAAMCAAFREYGVYR